LASVDPLIRFAWVGWSLLLNAPCKGNLQLPVPAKADWLKQLIKREAGFSNQEAVQEEMETLR
jgi:hypothetical protein